MLLHKPRQSVSIDEDAAQRLAWPAAMFLGSGIGVVSGVVGIGGGIILGPIILTFNLAKPGPTAALTSLYVLLTSGAALSSHLVQGGFVDWKLISVAGTAVLLGAFLGSKFGAGRASPTLIRRVFGGLVFVAGARLLLGVD
jgi:uncharacterized membrane protein YfcA